MRIVDEGSDNQVIASEQTRNKLDVTVHFTGTRNQVIIGEDCSAKGAVFRLGGASKIEIGPRCLLQQLSVFAPRNAFVRLGKGVIFTWKTDIHLHEPSRVTIGDNCLIASGTWFTTSDMHSIIDKATGKRINPPGDILLHDHVWIGNKATVMKGTTIGPDSVVAAFSVVTSDVPGECVVAGVPARVIRSGITWDHHLLEMGPD